jgi:hypothetical protein
VAAINSKEGRKAEGKAGGMVKRVDLGTFLYPEMAFSSLLPSERRSSIPSDIYLKET